MYDEYALIKKSTLTATANAIRTQKGTSDLIDPANFPTEIEQIEGGVGIDGGYVANFYDENGELIQAVAAKEATPIDAPNYECDAWFDSGGKSVTFPTTLTADSHFYAQSDLTYVDSLYMSAGLKKSDYPYLLVYWQVTGNNIVYFSKTSRKSGTATWYYGDDTVQYIYEGCANPSNYSNLDEVIQSLANSEKVYGPTTLTSMYVIVNQTDNVYFYSNFDLGCGEGYDNIYHFRLDVPIKTPDDGYSVVRFFDADSELIQTFEAKNGLLIDPPRHTCDRWVDSDGKSIVFPFILSGDIDIYAQSNSYYVDTLYNHFAVDKETYPYLVILVGEVDNGTSGHSIYFTNGFTSDNVAISGFYFYNLAVTVDAIDQLNLNGMVNRFKSNFSNSDLQAINYRTVMHYTSDACYVNFYGYFVDSWNAHYIGPVEEETSPFYTVNFYDYDQELLETHTAKVGNQIGSPLSFNAAWRDSESSVCTFPMTCDTGGKTIDIYANADTLADCIYTHYSIDREVYPYLTICIYSGLLYLVFSESVNATSATQFECVNSYTSTSYDSVSGAVDIAEIENVLYEKIGTSLQYSSAGTPFEADSNTILYLNYDIPISEHSATVYDLRV